MRGWNQTESVQNGGACFGFGKIELSFCVLVFSRTLNTLPFSFSSPSCLLLLVVLFSLHIVFFLFTFCLSMSNNTMSYKYIKNNFPFFPLFMLQIVCCVFVCCCCCCVYFDCVVYDIVLVIFAHFLLLFLISMFAACVCVFSCGFYFEYVFMCVCVVELKYFLVFFC